MKHRRAALSAAAAVLAVITLAGCSSAQQAIDQAQSVVDDAQQLVESAGSIASAPEALSQACQTALDGLQPDATPAQAEAALTEATAQLDEALGALGNLPMVSELRNALSGAAQSLVTDTSTTALDSVRQTIDGVCSAITLGGSNAT